MRNGVRRLVFDSQEKPREMSSTTADAAVPSEAVAAADREERRVSLFTLCLLALGVGIMTGVGAVALRSLIGLIHNAMFNGVLAVSKTDVWVAGEASSAKTSPVLAQFNGTAWASVTVPWKVQLDRITSDGAGGLWFTANPAKSPGTTWLLHRSASGKWTKTVIDPAGSSVFGLSLVAGTTSVVGAGNVATTQGSAAAVYLHGTLGS